MPFFTGEWIEVDEEGGVTLAVWENYGAQDEPADYRKHDTISLGHASRIRQPRGISLTPWAEDELTHALEAWESDDTPADPFADLRRDYERSTSPCYA